MTLFTLSTRYTQNATKHMNVLSHSSLWAQKRELCYEWLLWVIKRSPRPLSLKAANCAILCGMCAAGHMCVVQLDIFTLCTLPHLTATAAS